MKSIHIAGRAIGPEQPPYLIAELSANHNGKLETALRAIDAAKAAGADALKLQTYTPDTITLKADGEQFTIRGGLWDGRTLYDLYAEAHMPWEWHQPLFAHARRLGISLFSSPFDRSAVDLLEDLGAPAYKIASFEVIDLPLIRYAAATRKPMIISTGMASVQEIEEAIDAARSGGCPELAILHCVSGYPAPAADYNLKTVQEIAARFDVLTGLSDHTIGTTTAVAAVALGACIVEKHFTLDRSGGGPDDSFSSEPAEFAALVRECRTAWTALGRVTYGTRGSDAGNIQFRRSLYFVKDLRAGDLVDASCIRSVRPGFGLAPKMADAVIGTRVTRAIQANTPVTAEALGWAELPAGASPQKAP
jgi:N-acetylneuraminate synthase